MLLYVINVDSCIHIENYQIFFYEPAAKKQLDLFSASWDIASLTHTFGRVAEYINRRGFENRDYQVLVCVRRKESERWKETTLYAKAMVSQALEASGVISVITGAFTRKVHVLFQVEQPYYGTVPRTSVWEEELFGLNCLMDILGIQEQEQLDKKKLVSVWDDRLHEALERESDRRTDMVTDYLKDRLSKTLEEEFRQPETKEPADEVPELSVTEEEEVCEDTCEYISHRIRSLLDGSGLNRAAEVIYWPVPTKSSKAVRISMLSLADLIRSGEEVTPERVRECMTENHPDYEKKLLERYRNALCGYREQLLEKRKQILQELSEYRTEEKTEPVPACSVPEMSRGLSDRAELARQQLATCAVSLKKSRRNEVKERISDISQSLTEAFDGMEAELSAYKNEVKDYLYREIADSPYIRIGNETKERNGLPVQGISQMADGRDETAAKILISQWHQDMQFLTECTQLTGFVPGIAYLGGTMTAAMIPYLLYQGKVWTQKESLVSSLFVWAGLLIFMAGKRLFMNRYFVRSISESYMHLEKKLNEILEEYKERTQRFQGEIRHWLEVEKESERRQLLAEEKDKADRFSAMRAWHLANMQKIIAGLDTFGPMEQGYTQISGHPESMRRILQPMDYFQKEQGNEVYWPVIESEERKEETDE